MYFTQVFMPYWNFEYTTLHCGKSGREGVVWAKVLHQGDPSKVKSASSFSSEAGVGGLYRWSRHSVVRTFPS